MTMEKRHREIIRKHYVTLKRDLEAKPLLPYLLEMGVIEDIHRDEILSRRIPAERNEALIDILKKRGSQAFPKFVEALEKNQAFLACMLLREGRDKGGLFLFKGNRLSFC